MTGTMGASLTNIILELFFLLISILLFGWVSFIWDCFFNRLDKGRFRFIEEYCLLPLFTDFYAWNFFWYCLIPHFWVSKWNTHNYITILLYYNPFHELFVLLLFNHLMGFSFQFLFTNWCAKKSSRGLHFNLKVG